jgi:hypothetical protein
MRKFISSVAVAVLLALSVLPAVATAAEFIRPDMDSGDVVLSTTETHKNVYVAGGNVTVNSATMGDAVVAGGTITIDGAVESDVIVAGGTVTINNAVGGDVRVAGGTVVVNATVAGDVIAAGGSVTLSEKSKVGGDVALVGGTVFVHAPVTGKAWVSGGNITINNKISGQLTVKNASTVTFGPKAEVASGAVVRAETEPITKDGAKVGTIDYQRSQEYFSKTQLVKVALLGSAIAVLAYVLIALVLALVMPKRLGEFVTHQKAAFWANAGYGVVALIVPPVLVIGLFVSVIGYQLGFLILAAYVCALMLASALAALWAGSWVYALAGKHQTMTVNWKVAVIGGVLFSLVKFVPVLGGLFCFIVFLSSLGQLAVSSKRWVMEKKAEVI